jgi:hypothetical protein
MLSQIIEQIVGAFTKSESEDKTQVPESDKKHSSNLYTCSNCEETYIMNDIEFCPKCGESVEPTPSFSELGISPKGRN